MPAARTRRTVVLAFAQPADDGLPEAPRGRLRQLRDRWACERDLPECRPEIRAQLEAEKRRQWLGFGLLGGFALLAGLLILRQRRRSR